MNGAQDSLELDSCVCSRLLSEAAAGKEKRLFGCQDRFAETLSRGGIPERGFFIWECKAL